MPRTIAPRLHVLFARKASTAIIIRRGPSRHTAVIGWDRKTDDFKIGQWFYGRIYERRCDLSPDGNHLLYFAMNGLWGSSVKGSWSAISKAPYLRALTIYAKGDCWHGGGLFLSSHEYWLNDGGGHELQRDEAHLSRSATYPWHESYGGECPGVYFIRLQHDGWTMTHTESGDQGRQITFFEKRINDHWKLRKLAHAGIHNPVGRGVYYDTHELVNSRTEEAIPCESWEWAEVDGGRLVWAANGQLHAGHIGANMLSAERVLHDFNPMQFEKIKAPY